MSQFVPQHKLKTMADLDKGEESRLAIKNRHRKQAASHVVKWWSKKLGK
jgi:inosine/xanthosine triphosphate pyrophosphatase family protein